MADPVRLAIVGCGRIAQVAHLPAAEKAQGVELVAICDPSGEVAGSVARRYGVGAAGAVRADLHFPFYRRAATVHAYADGAVVTPALTDGDAYQRQLEAFARAIRAGGRPDPDVRDGLAAVRLIEATAAAVERGIEVTP